MPTPSSPPFPRPERADLFRWVAYGLFIVFIGNLGALIDAVLHPEIPYFDPEHLVVGGINAAAVAGALVAMEYYLLRRRKMEQAMHESFRRFQTLFENNLAGVAIAAGHTVLLANQAMLRIFGYTAEEFRRIPLIESIAPESRALFQERMARVERGETVPADCEYSIRGKDGSLRTVHAMSARITWEGRSCRQLVFIDITRHREAEAAVVAAHARLQKAGHRIKILSGLLPICCNCKRIRDDQKYWHQIDHYIAEHSEASFTHGFCPDCAQKCYPELDLTEPTRDRRESPR